MELETHFFIELTTFCLRMAALDSPSLKNRGGKRQPVAES